MKRHLLTFFGTMCALFPAVSQSQAVIQETNVVISKPASSSEINKEELERTRNVVITKKSEQITNQKQRIIPKNINGKGQPVYIIGVQDTNEKMKNNSVELHETTTLDE